MSLLMIRRLAALLVLVLAGCNSEPYQVAPVSGRVLLDGKPVVDAHVTFQPLGGGKIPGPGSTAITDAEGKYELHLMDSDREGAVVGKHRVTIASDRSSEANLKSEIAPAKAEEIPARYNSDSRLEFEVPAMGTDHADFDLKTP